MAKSKRKIYSSQRDKEAIAIAKKLKEKGILSKQTKLHGGKYISRGTLAKVRKLWFAASPEYKAIKITKDQARKAKENEYVIVQGNKLIVPNDKRFIERARKGLVSGVRPVKGGTMQEVYIPFTGDTVPNLLFKLENDQVDDLKLPDEQFAFMIEDQDRGGLSLRAFTGAQQMKNYLQFYRTDLPSSAIKFFRLKREDVPLLIRGPEERKRQRRLAGTMTKGRLRPKEKKPWHYPENMSPVKALMYRKAANERQKKRLEKIASDPLKLAKYREKAKANARRWREAQKSKSKK